MGFPLIALPPKAYLIGGAAAGIAVTAFWIGWEWRDRSADAELLAEQAKYDAAVIESQQRLIESREQARTIERLQRERLAALDEAAALRNREREVVEIEVEREVIRYVDRPNRVDVLLPVDWVRIHDRAALGRAASGMPNARGTESGQYAASPGVTDALALAVITGNYSACHDIRDQLITLQEWAATIQTRESP